MNNFTIIGGQSQATKKRIIAQRLRDGWTCNMNRKTGIYHIWIPPKKGKRKKKLKVYHDITCDCYDCRAGLSLRAKN